MTTTTMTSTKHKGARHKNTRGGTASKRPVPTRSKSTYQAGLSVETDPFRHRQMMIAEAAYYKAQERGFDPGHEVADWLGAEHDLQSRQGLE
jgi:hypothetical protein